MQNQARTKYSRALNRLRQAMVLAEKRRYFMPLYPALVLSAVLGCAGSSWSADNEGQSFVDNFDTFNRGIWFASDGWSNGKWQNCTWSKNELKLSDGVLNFTFQKKPSNGKEYSCAEIQSNKFYGYGTYEARLKTGTASGMVGAFFTYTGPQFKSVHDEIDFEVLLKDPSRMTVNTFVDGKGGHGGSIPLSPDAGDFHDYAFVWEKDRMRWYVDGRLAHEASSAAGPLPSNPQKIYASLWGSDTFTEWLGKFEDPGQPVTMQLDRVAFTKLGDACQFPESVACSAF